MKKQDRRRERTRDKPVDLRDGRRQIWREVYSVQRPRKGGGWRLNEGAVTVGAETVMVCLGGPCCSVRFEAGIRLIADGERKDSVMTV